MENSFKSKTYYTVQPISLTSDLLDIADMLKDLKKPRISQLTDSNISDLLYKGKLPFLDNSFNLTPIPFINYDLLQKLEFISKIQELDLNSFINLVKKYRDNIKPFNVPILFDNKLDFEGGYCNPIFLGNAEEIKEIVFTEFVLTSKLSILTPGIYAHEIVHLQLEYNNGVNNYIHSEVLPIFFDKLTALYMNDNYETLKTNEKLRFIRLFKAINNYKDKTLSLYNKTKLSMGIISILEAEKLFDRYLCGSSNDKNNIISRSNEVLLGKIQIENLLRETEITMDNCQDRQLIKRKITSML